MKHPQQQRAQATRDRILDAAEALFDDKGYDGTSMSALARAAGLSAGGLYEWFANKEEVLFGVGARHISELQEALLTRLAAAPPQSLEDLARALLGTALAHHQDRPRLHRFMYAEAPRPPALQEAVRETGVRIETYLASFLPEQTPEGAKTRAAIIYRAGEALLHDFVLDDTLPGTPEERLEEVISLLVAIAAR